MGTGSGWKVKWAACLRWDSACCGLRDRVTTAALKRLYDPLFSAETESLQFAPRNRNRAAAAMSVVVGDQEVLYARHRSAVQWERGGEGATCDWSKTGVGAAR